MLSQDIFTASTQKALLNQRFATDLSFQTTDILSELTKYLKRQLYDYDDIFEGGKTLAKKRRLETLLNKIEKRMEQVYSDIDELYEQSFKGLAADEMNFIADAIDDDLAGNLLLNRPDDVRLWAAVTQNPLHFPDSNTNPFVDFNAYVKSLGDTTKRVANAISSGYANGMTVTEVVKMIRGSKERNFSNGMIEFSNKKAREIVRTVTSHITAQSRQALYQANEDIIKGYILVATIDGRTSDTCKGWDGTFIRNDAKFKPKPPFHLFCRTVDVPDIRSESLKESGATRAVNFKGGGTVGQVSATKTYLEILKTQPAFIQEQALGKAKAELFRKSGLTVEEFREALTDTMGRPLTLAQMAEQNKKILEYMRKNKDMVIYLND